MLEHPEDFCDESILQEFAMLIPFNVSACYQYIHKINVSIGQGLKEKVKKRVINELEGQCLGKNGYVISVRRIFFHSILIFVVFISIAAPILSSMFHAFCVFLSLAVSTFLCLVLYIVFLSDTFSLHPSLSLSIIFLSLYSSLMLLIYLDPSYR